MKTKIYVYTIVFLLLLTSCSGGTVEPTATPVNIAAIQTEAVATFIADVTQSAAAFTPTSIPTETLTPTPPAPTETPTLAPNGIATEALCDNLEFISDSTVPDESIMAPGQEFVKTWKVRNSGACTWTTGYTIVNGGYGERMSGQTTALTAEVLPNTETEISITLKAPLTPGRYVGAWRLANNNGFTVGETLIVIIIVQ